MGVMMQAFYWDCPAREGRQGAWWEHLESNLPALRDSGFSAIWLPPASKGMSAAGMGYDPYDYYDLGEFDQKGGVETWFGSRRGLESLLRTAHSLQVQV
jgi:alpha-amylase